MIYFCAISTTSDFRNLLSGTSIAPTQKSTQPPHWYYWY